MTKPLKITLITLISLLMLAMIGYFVADSVVSSKIEDFLKTQLPGTMNVEYESLDVNIWSGRVVAVHPKIANKGSHTSKTNAVIELDTLLVDGFGYWDYLVNSNIHVESVQLRSPKVLYNHDKSIPKDEYKNSSFEQLKQRVKVDWFNIQNAQLDIRDVETDSIMLQMDKLTANVMDIILDNTSVKKPVPFNYSDYNLSFNNLMFAMGDYEKVKLTTAKITKKNGVFDKLKLFTKYSKSELDKMISIERDHFDVDIPSLVVEGYEFGYVQDSVFYFKSPKIVFETPEMHIYRNKLNADDLTRKSLYSKMLRELTFDLTLNEILLNNATIVYSEKVDVDMPAGELSFSSMNADIKNVSNTYGESEKTTLDIDAVFMKQTPIKVNWNFDVNDVNDAFVFKADIGKLPAADLNPFSRPNLKVQLEGELLKTYATISGDANTSRVNMRTNYEAFKVNVLDKEGKNKNKLLSTIANLFIKKDSNKAVDGYREAFKDGIERDKTKSIFNFLGLNMRTGLLSVFTGDGKE